MQKRKKKLCVQKLIMTTEIGMRLHHLAFVMMELKIGMRLNFCLFLGFLGMKKRLNHQYSVLSYLEVIMKVLTIEIG